MTIYMFRNMIYCKKCKYMLLLYYKNFYKGDTAYGKRHYVQQIFEW